MPAPNQSVAPSAIYEYRSTTGAYDIEATLGAPCRAIEVSVGGTLSCTKLDGVATATGTVLAGQSLVVQATDVTLGGGAEIWILL